MTYSGIIFDIKRFSINDGPGIRTTIFLKGCPLRCVWCHNPEGISPQPQRIYTRKKCIGCHTCVDECPVKALCLHPEGIVADEERCTLCRHCEEVCPTLAMKFAGRQWAMQDLMEEIEKERKVMTDSGGGVTLCGGEPLMHHTYLMELLTQLGQRNFHRCVDTTLYASNDVVRQVVQNCELLLVDLKHMDSDIHRRYTGVPNEPILQNLRMIAQMGADFFIRVPLIEGVNADETNIEASARFLESLPWTRKTVNLLPYHDIGKGKHEKLGTQYNPDDLAMATPGEATNQRCISQFAAHGIKAIIGG